MIRNYFIIACRNLLRNRTFSIINIFGLSLTVAFCLLLFFYIRHEQSYDSFHEKKNRLFRMEMTNLLASSEKKSNKHLFSFLTGDADANNTVVFPLVVGRDIRKDLPDIKTVTRFKANEYELIKVDDKVFKERGLIWADDNFFSNFSFPLIKGNAATALASRESIVITESLAKRCFGTTDVIGRVIEFTGEGGLLYKVSAVAADMPANSSIQANMVVRSDSDPDYEENIKQGFNRSSHLLIVELAEGVSPKQFEPKLNKWAKSYYIEPFKAEYGQYFPNVDFSKLRWQLRPLAECHYNASGVWGHYTSEKNIYLLTCLVIVILLVASLNYILLTVSNAAARSQEVGVRKVMGASRSTVVMQFWVEAQVVVLLAIAFGFVLAQLLLPLLNKIADTALHLNEFSGKEIIITLVALCLGLGVLAGYYPALLLSKPKPVSVMKSFGTFKINPRFSRVLVITQYTVCVVLMIAALVINRQMNYINNKDLGFDKEQVLMVSNPTWDFGFTKKVKERLYLFARSQPWITHYSGMNGGLTGSYNTNGFKLHGEQKWLKQLTVDFDYFEMLGVQFVKGRPFSRNISSDTSRTVRACVVNETLFNLLGKDARVGVYNEDIRGTIIGVVKDYHFESLSKKIEPEQHVLARDYVMYFMFKIKAGYLPTAIKAIGDEWKQITRNYPFEYTFLDQTIAKMYQPDMRWLMIVQVSCFFAILISCMGLFGLSAINAANRTKEIGIRKVLGAGIPQILATLSKSFIVMVSLAILIAIPLAWWIMNSWLEDFAYRIEISWWMFMLVAAAALIIAMIAVSYQAMRAAVVNPVKSLRME